MVSKDCNTDWLMFHEQHYKLSDWETDFDAQNSRKIGNYFQSSQYVIICVLVRVAAVCCLYVRCVFMLKSPAVRWLISHKLEIWLHICSQGMSGVKYRGLVLPSIIDRPSLNKGMSSGSDVYLPRNTWFISSGVAENN